MPDGGNALGGDFPSLIQSLEASGPGSVSPTGATGTMQVMPRTANQPGFGIQPSDGSAADTERLGQEYARAMLAKYQGNQVLASAAYNAGPGAVDRWVKQIGNPLTGEISNADFVHQIPYAETRNYAGRAMNGLGGAGGQPTVVDINTLLPVGQGTQRSDMSALAGKLTGAGAGAGPTPSASTALHLISLLVPPTHKLVQVDYNPYAKGLPGAGTS